MSKIEIEQVWHHIEDFLSPSNVQMIRQVMDIYVSGDYIAINFEGKELFGLQIFGRNQDNELAFIHDKGRLNVNIDNLNWPNEMFPVDPKNPRKHLKIEIKYYESAKFDGITGNELKYYFSNLWKNIKDSISSKKLHIDSWYAYTGRTEINWPIRPEFTVTLPLGLKIIGNKSTKLFFYRIYPEGSIVEGEKKEKGYVKPFEFDLKKPDITQVNGKRVYTFVIGKKDYDNIILKTPDDCKMHFIFEYDVGYEDRFVWVPTFGAILTFFILFIVVKSLFSDQNSVINNILSPTVFVAFLSYTVLILTLKREGYIIPLKNYVKYFMVIMSLTIIIWIVITFSMYIISKI